MSDLPSDADSSANHPSADAGAPGPSPSGILVIDKPLGKTSRAMCTLVRTRLRRGGAPKRIKVGHAGTLDPLATGVVIILIGRATRLCERMMAGEKRYLADIDLAHVSASHDLESPIKDVQIDRVPEMDAIERTCATFVGRIQQTPPAFSAMKVNGRRAYQLARQGQDPKLSPREIVIHSIEIMEYEFPGLRLDIQCGKGTYIRSLAFDLGASLGVWGMLSGLQRTRVGEYTLEQSVCPEDLPEAMGQCDLLEMPEP